MSRATLTCTHMLLNAMLAQDFVCAKAGASIVVPVHCTIHMCLISTGLHDVGNTRRILQILVLGLASQPGHVTGVLLQGCIGLVTPDTTDVLSHAAVRARNCSVLLVSCSDAAALQGLRALAGRSVELSILQL